MVGFVVDIQEFVVGFSKWKENVNKINTNNHVTWVL